MENGDNGDDDVTAATSNDVIDGDALEEEDEESRWLENSFDGITNRRQLADRSRSGGGGRTSGISFNFWKQSPVANLIKPLRL